MDIAEAYCYKRGNQIRISKMHKIRNIVNGPLLFEEKKEILSMLIENNLKYFGKPRNPV